MKLLFILLLGLGFSQTELTLTLVSDECGEDRAFFIANQSTAIWGRITNE